MSDVQVSEAHRAAVVGANFIADNDDVPEDFLDKFINYWLLSGLVVM